MDTIPPATDEAATKPEPISERRRSASRRRRWLFTLAEVALLAAALLAIRAYQRRDAIVGEAPTFDARGVDGGVVSLAALRGRPVMIHFWASWCGVCRAMEGNVLGLAEIHPDQVLTVATQSGDAGAIRRFMREQGLDTANGDPALTVVPDPGGQLARAYGVEAFPTTFFLDAEGKVRTVEVGYTTAVGLRARLFWAGL